MHLVHISCVGREYIGESDLAPEPLMEEVVTGETVTLNNATEVRHVMNNQGQEMVKQMPLIQNHLLNPNVAINPRYILDIRGIPKKSPLRKQYEKEYQKARTGNAGITVVKNMPTDLPPQPNLN